MDLNQKSLHFIFFIWFLEVLGFLHIEFETLGYPSKVSSILKSWHFNKRAGTKKMIMTQVLLHVLYILPPTKRQNARFRKLIINSNLNLIMAINYNVIIILITLRVPYIFLFSLWVHLQLTRDYFLALKLAAIYW